MKKLVSILFIGLFSTLSFSQFSVMGGASMLKGFGSDGVYPGINLGFEMPVDDMSSYYAKIGYYFPKKDSLGYSLQIDAFDQINTIPNVSHVNGRYSFNYTTIEAGRRMYFGDGYDGGFSFYGGSHIMAVFNTVKLLPGNFDESKYKLSSGYDPKGSIFSLAFGIGGGIKNSFPFGTLFADFNADLMLLGGIPSNDTAFQLGSQKYSSVLFVFSVGYRKDIF